MKLYTFTHTMLSTKQQGIQSQHATTELFNKFKEIDLMEYSLGTGTVPPRHVVDEANRARILFDWSNNHKTHIALDGGTSVGLNDILEVFKLHNELDGLEYPWATFYEDESLGGLLTSISIVLPEKIYWIINQLKVDKETLDSDERMKLAVIMTSFGELSKFDVWLIENLPKYRLAK